MKKQGKRVRTNSIPSQPVGREVFANQTPSGVRHISPQKHQKIKRKVLAIHDGLLRRLAEHDRQR